MRVEWTIGSSAIKEVGYGSPIQLPAQSINAIHSTGEFVFATLWLRAGKKISTAAAAFSQKPEWPLLSQAEYWAAAFATEPTLAALTKEPIPPNPPNYIHISN